MMTPSILGENLFDELMEYPFGRTFEHAFHNPVFGKREKNLMKTDVREKDGYYELDMDLPGYKKEEVNAKLEDGYLTISASRGVDKSEQDKDGRFIRQERYTGSCQRSFYVGEGVKQSDIKASFENGILHLAVPKVEKKEAEENKYISID